MEVYQFAIALLGRNVINAEFIYSDCTSVNIKAEVAEHEVDGVVAVLVDGDYYVFRLGRSVAINGNSIWLCIVDAIEVF